MLGYFLYDMISGYCILIFCSAAIMRIKTYFNFDPCARDGPLSLFLF